MHTEPCRETQRQIKTQIQTHVRIVEESPKLFHFNKQCTVATIRAETKASVLLLIICQLFAHYTLWNKALCEQWGREGRWNVFGSQSH